MTHSTVGDPQRFDEKWSTDGGLVAALHHLHKEPTAMQLCTEHRMNVWVPAYLDEERPGRVLICGRSHPLLLETPAENLRPAKFLAGRSCLVCDYYDLRWHPPYPREKLLELDPDEDLSWIDLSLE